MAIEFYLVFYFNFYKSLEKYKLIFSYPNLTLFSIFSLILFFIYDYSKRKKIKRVIFYRFILEINNLI